MAGPEKPDPALLAGVYGAPAPHLAPIAAHARQFSPLQPGADDLAAAAPGAFAEFTMVAPAGTLERRHVFALALRALAPGASLTAIAAKDKGGLRMAKELAAFGCAVAEGSKSHHRICAAQRPQALIGVEEAILAGGPRLVEGIGLWSQPGVFSWERIDPGSAILASRLARLHGVGADLGAGIGYLSRAVLQSPAVTHLHLVELDRRAHECAKRNVVDVRAQFHWADATRAALDLSGLDFVVMNPPFHNAAIEDKALGQAFIRAAAKRLRRGGACWLVANRHLPYEAELAAAFKSVRLDHEEGGYKVFEAKA